MVSHQRRKVIAPPGISMKNNNHKGCALIKVNKAQPSHKWHRSLVSSGLSVFRIPACAQRITLTLLIIQDIPEMSIP